MAKKNSINLESLCTGILFCISLVALIIACLAYNKKPSVGGGNIIVEPAPIIMTY